MARPRRDDALDCLAREWATTRRELLGLRTPIHANQYVGALRSALRNVQRQHDGAGAFTSREQHFPEVYEGDALLVNLAFHRMPPRLASVYEVHYCLRANCYDKAELLCMSVNCYHKALADAKSFVSGYLAAGSAESAA